MAHRPRPSKLVAIIKRYRITWAVITLASNALAIALGSSLGRNLASGTARLWYHTCRPYCAAGNYHKYRVKVRVDRVGTTSGHTYFKRFRYGRTSLTHSYRLPARPPYPGHG